MKGLRLKYDSEEYLNNSLAPPAFSFPREEKQYQRKRKSGELEVNPHVGKIFSFAVTIVCPLSLQPRRKPFIFYLISFRWKRHYSLYLKQSETQVK